MHREESRLLKKIAASPWSDGPRLEYAAWLERQGDKSQSDQAEFLRLDVEREQLAPVIFGSCDYSPAQYDRFWEIRRRMGDIELSLDPAWRIRVDRDLGIPPELSAQGKKAAELILDFLLAEGLAGTCGCRAFYSPQEWQERGEKFGHDSLLILVYDSDHIGRYMDPSQGENDLFSRFIDNVEQHGFVFQACTSDYSAIYELEGYKPFSIELDWPIP